jgi:putative oxidoreductase
MPLLDRFAPLLEFLGRLALGGMFVWFGIDKTGAYAATQGYMARFGVPGVLAPAVIALEIVAGLLVMIGWHTRLAALALAGFCLTSALIFHMGWGARMEFIQFWKNMALAGAFLMLAANGPGGWSLDRGR